MLVTYLRSSSIGTYSLCPFKYYINYLLGIPEVAGVKADKGSIVHKALELVAQKKLAIQQGKDTVYNDELERTFTLDEISDTKPLRYAWDYYTKKYSHHNWFAVDRYSGTKPAEDCLAWFKRVEEFNDGMFWPMNRDVLMPEEYFDMPIEEPWAEFGYKDPYTEEYVKSRLSIKGTIDLVTRINDDTIEYIDWKTGKRTDWATRKTKDYKSLYYDPQLLLYFYALTKLYPNVKYIYVTIFFIQDGGPFSICYEPEHVKTALDMLHRKFDAIKNDYTLQRVKHTKNQFRCGFCHYDKAKLPGSDKVICEELYGELQQLGMERLTKKRGDPATFGKYGNGGGLTNRDAKPTESIQTG